MGGLDTRTKTIGLLLLVVNSIFCVAVFAGGPDELSGAEFVVALIVLGVVLVGSLVAIVTIEIRGKTSAVVPSGLTPSTKVLDQLINGTLETVCRATSLPQTPESANLRVFIFRVEPDQQLVCRYYWSPNPTREEVGITRFSITEETFKEIAVVQCVMSRRITRARVRPLSQTTARRVEGEIKPDLRFVLAAPIFDDDNNVWGTVDFDTSTETGEALLSTGIAEAAMHQLSQHLRVIFALGALTPQE